MSTATTAIREIVQPSRARSFYFPTVLAAALFLTFILAPNYFFTKPVAPNILVLLIFTAVSSVAFIVLRQTLFVFFNSVIFFLISYPFYLQDFFRFRYMGGAESDLTPTTIVLSCIFLAIVNGIGVLSAGRAIPRPAGTAPARDPSLHMGPVRAALIGILAAILIVLLFGYEEIFLPRQKYFLYGVERLGNFERFFIGILRLMPYWALYFYILSPHRGSRASIFLGALPIFCIAILVSNPVNTQRFLSLFGFLIIFFALVRTGRMVGAWRHAYALVAVGLIILPATSIMRSGVFVFDPKIWASTLFSLEFSALAMLNDLFLIPYAADTGPVRLLSAVLIFVPRAIWPSKNEGTGESIAEAAGYWWHNVGVPPIADAYLDFGIAGVVLLAVAVGFALRHASSALTPRTRLDNGVLTGAKISLAGLIPLLLRGDLSTFFVAFYTSIIAFAIVRVVSRVRVRIRTVP